MIAHALLALLAQTSSGDCNNQSRTLELAAGETKTFTNCPTFSFSIGAFTFTSPSSCPSSRTVRMDDTFTCGPMGQDLHCDPRGFKVCVKMYESDQPCPVVPTTLPESVREANKLITCQRLPLVSMKGTFSATVTSCPKPAPLPPGVSLVVSSPGSLSRLQGDVGAALPALPTLERLEGLDLALEASADLTGAPRVLRQAMALHRALPGVGDVRATVELTFSDTGGREVVNRHRIEGRVLGDGRFAVVNVTTATLEGAPDLYIEDLVFDGFAFFVGPRGGHAYSAYPSDSDLCWTELGLQAQGVDPLVDWVRSPLWLAAVPGTAWAVVESASEVRVVETYPDVASTLPLGGRTEYVFPAGSAHPSSIETYGPDGRLRWHRRFADYRELAPGVWRPFRAVDWRWPGGGAAAVTVDVRVDGAAALDEDRAAEPLRRPEPPSGEWIVSR